MQNVPLSPDALRRLQTATFAATVAEDNAVYARVARIARELLGADAVALWSEAASGAERSLLASDPPLPTQPDPMQPEGGAWLTYPEDLTFPVGLDRNATPIGYTAREALPGGFWSLLAVPLQPIRVVLPIATLVAYGRSRRHWDRGSESALLLELFAPHAAQKLDNVRLRARLERATNEARMASEIARCLASSTERDLLLQSVIMRLTLGMGAKHGGVFLVEPGTSGEAELKIRAHYGLSSVYIGLINTPSGVVLDPNHPNGRGPAAACVREGRPFAIPDIMSDPRGAVLRGRAATAGYRSLFLVPLCAQSRTHGCLALYYTEQTHFTTTQTNFALAVADGVTLSLERLDLVARLVEEEVAMRSLNETNRLKGEFVSTVSHELRTPLTIIKGYGDLLVSGQAGPLTDTQERFMVAVQKNTTRLTELVGDLLDISQMEQGRMKMQIEDVDLARLTHEMCGGITRVAAERDITVECNVPEPKDGVSYIVRGDQKRLSQVLNNLLSNAVKYSPAGQLVSVSCVYHGGNRKDVEVQVRDRGDGIAPAAQTRLFEKFYRVDSSLTREVGGTGLGLAICKAIVEQHQGHIWMENAPDRGSIFAFSLPAATPGDSLETGERHLTTKRTANTETALEPAYAGV